MKQLYFIAITLLLAAAGIQTQTGTFFPTKTGMVLVMAEKNGAGKVKSHTRTTIDAVRGKVDSLYVDYTIELLDQKMELAGEDHGTIRCTTSVIDGVVVLDMKEFSAPMAKAMEGMKVEISGIPPEISGRMKPGDKIPDANVTVSAAAGMMKLKSVLSITDAGCTGIEEITIPAGTFSCYKVTQNTAATTMGMTVRGRSVAWYARGIGMVKCEAYDAKGKLMSSSELISLKYPEK